MFDLALAADKGGVGKSTLAYHLAVCWQQAGRDVGLLDLDRCRASSAWCAAGPPPRPNAYPLATLPATLPPHEVRLWDTPAHPSAAMRAGLRACDLVLVVAAGDRYSQEAALALTADLLAKGVTARLVLNQMAPTGREAAETLAALTAAGWPCCRQTVRRYSCYQHAQWDGLSVGERAYGSHLQAWSDISGLAAELAAFTTQGVSHGA